MSATMTCTECGRSLDGPSSDNRDRLSLAIADVIDSFERARGDVTDDEVLLALSDQIDVAIDHAAFRRSRMGGAK